MRRLSCVPYRCRWQWAAGIKFSRPTRLSLSLSLRQAMCMHIIRITGGAPSTTFAFAGTSYSYMQHIYAVIYIIKGHEKYLYITCGIFAANSLRFMTIPKATFFIGSLNDTQPTASRDKCDIFYALPYQ